MNAAHVHLILNHVPVLGEYFGLGLLLFGLGRGSEDIKKAALGTFCIAALLTIPVYLTGDPAAHAVRGLPGVAEDLIKEHDEAAGFALAAMSVLGLLSLAGLVLFRRRAVSTWFNGIVVAVALFTATVVTRTAWLGGQIHHPEIRSYGNPPEPGGL